MNDNTEKICTLSVDHAIRIAKIISTAPEARLPMIAQLFQQASVDLDGLDALIESSSLKAAGRLIDTSEFVRELTAGRELTDRGYLFTPDEFNRFCLDRGLQPRLVKRHLYVKGYIEATKEPSGKLAYSITIYIDGASQRRIAVKAQREKEMAE